MVVRVFRACVATERQAEFELGLRDKSLPLLDCQDGLVARVAARPLESAPDVYLIVSVWRDQAALESFAGADWRVPVIPAGMEDLMLEAWVDHYVSVE